MREETGVRAREGGEARETCIVVDAAAHGAGCGASLCILAMGAALETARSSSDFQARFCIAAGRSAATAMSKGKKRPPDGSPSAKPPTALIFFGTAILTVLVGVILSSATREPPPKLDQRCRAGSTYEAAEIAAAAAAAEAAKAATEQHTGDDSAHRKSTQPNRPPASAGATAATR